jgi:hypothetical protein
MALAEVISQSPIDIDSQDVQKTDHNSRRFATTRKHDFREEFNMLKKTLMYGGSRGNRKQYHPLYERLKKRHDEGIMTPSNTTTDKLSAEV